MVDPDLDTVVKLSYDTAIALVRHALQWVSVFLRSCHIFFMTENPLDKWTLHWVLRGWKVAKGGLCCPPLQGRICLK